MTAVKKNSEDRFSNDFDENQRNSQVKKLLLFLVLGTILDGSHADSKALET